jgi:hypothetical protein
MQYNGSDPHFLTDPVLKPHQRDGPAKAPPRIAD